MSLVVNLLRMARKPVVLIGNGMRYDVERKDFNPTFGVLQIPVLTTWRAADFVTEHHPQYCGRPGMIGQRGANFVLQSCDLLICLGARLDLAQVAFNYEKFAPQATKVVVDIDKAELDKLPEDFIKINESCISFMSTLKKDLSHENIPQWNKWLGHCKKLHQKYQYQLLDEAEDQNGNNSLYRFLYELNEHLIYETIVIGSSGSIAEVFFQIIEFKAGMRVINNPGLGSMGFAIPAAIGAYYGGYGDRIICIDGDGSFAMNMQELQYVAENKLPIQFYVINNGGYASIQNTQANLKMKEFGSSRGSGLDLPDWISIAKGFNIRYRSISNYLDFPETVMPDKNLPAICEVITNADHRTVCRTLTRQMPDGKLENSGLDDLWPFLNEDERKKAMTFQC